MTHYRECVMPFGVSGDPNPLRGSRIFVYVVFS